MPATAVASARTVIAVNPNHIAVQVFPVAA
jgi:hypothetical protein